MGGASRWKPRHVDTAESALLRGSGLLPNQRRKFDVSALQVRLCIFRRFSFPCWMSSTGSEGAIHLFALTSYTDVCVPSALCSEKSLRCSPPILISAQTPSSSIGESRSMVTDLILPDNVCLGVRAISIWVTEIDSIGREEAGPWQALSGCLLESGIVPTAV